MVWQPIGTAPKDGTWVLTYSGHGIHAAHYFSFLGWQLFETAEYDNEYSTLDDVTHWMPLPSPPEAA